MNGRLAVFGTFLCGLSVACSPLKKQTTLDIAVAPVFSPAPGTFTADTAVTLSTTTAAATIFFTVDGSAPSTASTPYTGPIAVAGDGTQVTIRAVASAAGLTTSDETSGTYTIAYAATNAAAEPTATPAAGTYATDQLVTLTSATSGASIYYTTDGSLPTSASTLYSSAIPAAGNGTALTINAIAVLAGLSNSAVRTATYTIAYPTAPAPIFSKTGATFSTDQSISLSTIASGASIYYTLDGSSPSTSSTLYTAPIPVAGNGTSLTITAITVAPAFTDSAPISETYTIAYPAAAIPTLSEPGGSYPTDQIISLSTVTSNGSIYYTLNGTLPSASSTLYSTPISVAGNGTSVTIAAITVAAGLSDSAPTTATYTIAYPTTVQPVIAPAKSIIEPDENVSLSTTTGGAVIYYTTDGSTPTNASSVYSAPFQLPSGSVAVKAFATSVGLLDSSVVTASFCVAALSYVSTAGDDGADGSSATPFLTIAHAASTAASSPACATHIRVGAGSYCVGGLGVGCSAQIALVDDVGLFGGYDPADWTRNVSANTTTIKDGGGSVAPIFAPIAINSGATNATVVDGFTITGRADLSGGDSVACIYSDSGSPIINDNVLESDTTVGVAGSFYGIYSSGGSPRITANTIVAAEDGSAFGLFLGANPSASSPFVFNNTIDTSAPAVAFNFGIAIDGGATPTISNNSIAFGAIDATSGIESSGVGTYVYASDPSAAASTIENNIIWTAATGTTRCVVAQYVDQAPASLKNNDLFGCASLYADASGTHSQSTIAGVNALTFASGNISFDLLGGNVYFVDDTADWHLQTGDPSTGAGFLTVKTGALSNGAAAAVFHATTDRDGNPRTSDGSGTGWSMGAFEQDL